MDYKEKVIALLNSQELSKEQKEKLKDIFPKLRESEDERIRKALIKYFTLSDDNADYQCCGVHCKDIVAWLEKQGKQKNTFSQPTEGEFPYNNPSNTLDGEIDNIWKKLSCGNEFCSNKNGFHEVIVHFANWIKNQSNKKWHYSNEKCMDNDALVLFHSTFDNTWNLKNSSIINWNVVGKWALLSDILPAEEYNITGVGSKNAQGKFGEMIKNLKPVNKVFEQKPAVDTKVIIPKFRVGDIVKSKSQPMLSPRKIISIGKDCYWCEDRGCIGFAWEDDCEIVEQKTAWSEDDENRINRLIAYFEDKESFTAEDDVVYANWLKSIRPQSQWKPSDEQMEALEHSLGDYNIKVFEDRYEILKSLYQDLKKLKG